MRQREAILGEPEEQRDQVLLDDVAGRMDTPNDHVTTRDGQHVVGV